MKTQTKLKSFYEQYKGNFSLVPLYTSFVCLAELYNFISTKFVNKKERHYWRNVIYSEIKQFKKLDKIILLLKEREGRVDHILNFGAYFDEDEILLLLTFLIEIEQVQKLLKDFDLLNHYKPMKNLNEKFISTMNNVLNTKNYEISKNMIIKNSTLPIVSKFI